MLRRLFSHKNGIKNMLIGVLFLAAIFQTSLLWFGGLAGLKGMTAMFGAGGGGDVSGALESLVTPYRVITYIDDADIYQIKYDGLDEYAPLAASKDVLEKILRLGEYAGTAAEPARGGVTLEYGFNMPAEAFTKVYKQRSNLFTSKVKNFSAVNVYTDGNGICAAFILDDNPITVNGEWVFRLNDFALKEAFETAVSGERDKAESGIYYTRRDGVYTPSWRGELIGYRPVVVSNPLGELTYANLSRRFEPFFAGQSLPGAPRIQDGVYTFANERTTIAYAPTGVLECYFSYQHFSNSVIDSLEGCYNAALSVLEKDEALGGGYYLSGAEKTKNGASFTFDARVGDLPVVLSKERQGAGLSHLIEITVEKEYIRYRRYVVAFGGAETSVVMRNSYESAAAGFGMDADEPVTGITLGYRLESEGEMFLSWFIETAGTVIAVSAD